MRFIYNIRRKTIREKKPGSKCVWLTRAEARFLEALLNERINTHEEIATHVFRHRNGFWIKRYLQRELSSLKTRVKDKINIDIQSIYGKGIILKDKVYVECR